MNGAGPRSPALDAWRAELGARERTRTTFDPLWKAACEEASALEVERIAPVLAAAHRREAFAILKRAARGAAA